MRGNCAVQKQSLIFSILPRSSPLRSRAGLALFAPAGLNFAQSPLRANSERDVMQTLTVLHPLPNPHAFRRSQVQRFSRLDIESRVPGVDIANRICPELGGRVRINRQLLAERSFPRLRRIVLT